MSHIERLVARVDAAHRRQFGIDPAIRAYAPGRVEILGNHTDYNEGFVLSAAIDAGIVFALTPDEDRRAVVQAADIERCLAIALSPLRPVTRGRWSNYVRGVLNFLVPDAAARRGFRATFGGDIPMGSGLSSSAALEISSGLALARRHGLDVPPLELARIGQQAEHRFAGVRCGLLDQITSLWGAEQSLVFTDFRTLAVRRVRMPAGAAFLVCHTGVKHALVDSAYNERREACERAAAHFARRLPHPVTHLRDVSTDEWAREKDGLDPAAARRAAHPIGENERVLEGVAALERGDPAAFGGLMSASHRSSREHFENSCAELDFVVETAQAADGVWGARLSGGGFGGSAVAMVREDAAEAVGRRLASAYRERFGHEAGVQVVVPSAGARLLDDGPAVRAAGGRGGAT
jgi:galactokinase